MTLTIELCPNEGARLIENARAAGKRPEDVVRDVIARMPEPTDVVEDHTDELFDKWDAEDAAMTTEEYDYAAAQWEDLTAKRLPARSVMSLANIANVGGSW